MVIATDADVDGMHIRLLLITFFLQFFPELIRRGIYLFCKLRCFGCATKRPRLYCYDDTERDAAIKTLGRNPEITRFKGLGEISPDEFKHFIGDDVRLDPVKIDAHESIKEMLKFFMGKNTPIRQEYIIRNLRFEHDLVEGWRWHRRMKQADLLPEQVRRPGLQKQKWLRVPLPELFS